MLAWVVIFLLVAAGAGIFSFGFGAIASVSVGIAKIIFWLAAAGFVGSLALYLMRRPRD